MRKMSLCLFESFRFLSMADGTPRSWPMLLNKVDPKTLGQASTILLDVIGWQADANAEMKVEFYATSYPEIRPSEVGADFIGGTSWSSDLRPDTYALAGPFPAHVDAVLQVQDASAQDKSLKAFTAEVWVTLIFND